MAPGSPGFRPQDAYSRVGWGVRTVRRNLTWLRTQGARRLWEEHELDPVRRTVLAARRARWRSAHGLPPGSARGVFLIGVPRSGTNLMVRALEASPEVEVYNEGDRPAFWRYRLRPDPVVAALVRRSRHRLVVVKPLLDAHRVVGLLDDLGLSPAPRAVFAFRDVDGCVRSHLEKFGSESLEALQDIAADPASPRWQTQGLSEDSRRLLRETDWAAMTPPDGAALVWLVRNRMFFEQGLDRRADVQPLSYDALVRAPEPVVRRLCAFLDVRPVPAMLAQVDGRSLRRPPHFALHPTVRALCDEMGARLDAAYAATA